MKVRLNVELEATDAELRDLAVDVAHRTGAKLIGTVVESIGPSMPSISSAIADMLRNIRNVAAEPGAEPVDPSDGGCPPGGCCPPGGAPDPGPWTGPPQPTPAQPPRAPEPVPDFSSKRCGDPLPGDTVIGVMWTNLQKDPENPDAPEKDVGCQERIAYIVSCPQFGNRGSVRRVCCEKHMNYLTASGMPCVVAGIPS
jgi:hypothetical protein